MGGSAAEVKSEIWRSYRESTEQRQEYDVMASIPRCPWTLQKKREEKLWNSWEKVGQSGKWPQQSCTTMFFLIPKNVTSERPIAPMPTFIRWWEALRAPEVAKLQMRYRVDWTKRRSPSLGVGNIDGHGKVLWQSKRRGSRGGSFGSGPGEGRACQPVVWAWATHFGFPRKILRVLCGYFEHQRRLMCGRAAADHHDHLARVKVELLRIVLQDALSEVTKIYPPLKLIVFVDDITALLKGKIKMWRKWQRR